MQDRNTKYKEALDKHRAELCKNRPEQIEKEQKQRDLANELLIKNNILAALMKAAHLDINVDEAHLNPLFIIHVLTEKLQISNKYEEATREV